MTLDPKSLEFAIKVGLLAYPSLFQVREQVINHLYCVLGNGYDWWDGRLRETCKDEKHEIVQKMLLDGKPEEKIRKAIAKIDKNQFPFKDLEKKLKELGVDFDPKPHPLTIYPVCDLCAIMKLPDHIRPDWLAGAEEAVHLMETTKSYDEKGTENNHKFVPVIRERIAALKANGSGGGTSRMMLAV